MGKFDHGPVRARDLTEQLKDKSRGRRARLVGVAAATSSTVPDAMTSYPDWTCSMFPLRTFERLLAPFGN